VEPSAAAEVDLLDLPEEAELMEALDALLM